MSASFHSKTELYELDSSESSAKRSGKVRLLTIISVVLFFACVGLAAALIVIILENDTNSSPVNGDDEKYCLTSHCAMMAGAMAQRMNPDVDPCEDFIEFSCGRWVKRTVIPEDRSSFTTFSELRNDLDIMLKAGDMAERMNFEADPCQDFYEYSCGAWLKKTVIPEDRSSFDTFSTLRDDVDIKLKDLVEQPIQDGDLDPVKNVKKNYVACSDIETIENRGASPLVALMGDIGGWPVLGNNSGGNWDESAFVLEDQLALLRGKYGNSMIYYGYVGIDNKDSTRYILKLDQPSLGLPSRNYYLEDGRDNKYLTAYFDYMKTIAVMLGADDAEAENDFNDLIDFEIQLANLTTPSDQRRDNNALYNKMTIAQLQYNVTDFNWLHYFGQFGASWSEGLEADEEIVVYEPRYVREVTDLVNSIPNRTIANYIVWLITMNRVSQLSSDFRAVEQKYYEVVYGTASESARWQTCVGHVNNVMDFAVGRMFVDVHYDEESKARTNEMIDFIETAFLEMVDESEWMDKETQVVAKEKARAMYRKIGYPDWIKDDSELTEYYQNYNFDASQYFENYLQYLEESAQRGFESLREPVDKLRWSTGPAIVNAFYSSSSNSITFPAGILQPLFYHKNSPDYLNFGGIGMVIGHEITHGFDDRGRQYDKNGNLEQWWSQESIDNYVDRAQCIVDQYGGYYMEECNMTLNGVQTQGENIADNGGLKETYRGYRKMVHESLSGEEELLLPGIDLTQDQMLFVNFAQIWCSKYTEQGAKNRILTGVHSPGPFRVQGPIANLPEFADVFQCPASSPMNPDDKCTVW